MEKKQRINAFVQCGLFINRHFNQDNWLKNEVNLHQALNQLIETAYTFNGWFTADFIKDALINISGMLNEKSLTEFTENIPESIKPKTVSIIMAGNIPMVGFHDLMCVVLSGHTALIKLSSDDNILMPFFIKLLEYYESGMAEKIYFASGKLSNFDAVIATGSNNTSQHFEYYFGKYPHIIRKNRTSVAVLTGNETKEDLKNLGKDIFMYFGLGCRNVSKLMVPERYIFDSLFEAVFEFGYVANNKKYSNNYDYSRTVYLLNSEKFLDNNFLIIKPDKGLFSPVSVLFSQEYKSHDEINAFLNENRDKIQVIVGSPQNYVPFGYSQRPVITDFADDVNTLNFLVNL